MRILRTNWIPMIQYTNWEDQARQIGVIVCVEVIQGQIIVTIRVKEGLKTYRVVRTHGGTKLKPF